MRNLFLILIFAFTATFSMAQELKCQVAINSQQITGDKTRFQTLQTAINEFMNDRKWTNRVFKPEEKIECSIFITFNKSTSGDNYQGSIQIQSLRPIFNSAYKSPVLNIKDNNLSFKWVEHDPLNFDLNSFTSNLTSVLAYYAYIIIGTDFDTYSANGGSDFFTNAQTIVNNAQNTQFLGWKSSGSEKNRYWYVENILNSRYVDFRSFMYQYHRKGLDIMYDDLSKGRVVALNSLKMLQKLHRIRPNLVITNRLMDAKRDEFIGLFTGAQPNERIQAKNILTELDPANAGKYQKMNAGPKK